MKKFLAIYIGTRAARDKSRWDELDEQEQQALQASGLTVALRMIGGR